MRKAIKNLDGKEIKPRDSWFSLEEDEQNMVVTIEGSGAQALNLMLPWNLQRPFFRKVWKKFTDGRPIKEAHCDFSEAFERKLNGEGLPSQMEQQYLDEQNK